MDLSKLVVLPWFSSPSWPSPAPGAPYNYHVIEHFVGDWEEVRLVGEAKCGVKALRSIIIAVEMGCVENTHIDREAGDNTAVTGVSLRVDTTKYSTIYFLRVPPVKDRQSC